MLLLFFQQQVLIGDRDRHLRLYLKQLILHVDDHLLQQFLRIFRLIQKIVDVCSYQRCYTLHECHISPPL